MQEAAVGDNVGGWSLIESSGSSSLVEASSAASSLVESSSASASLVGASSILELFSHDYKLFNSDIFDSIFYGGLGFLILVGIWKECCFD